MAKKKAKVVQVQAEPTEEIRVDDLYTAFRAAYEALKHGRYKLFLKAREHFLAEEYQKAQDEFRKLKESLIKHSLDKPTPAKATKLAEYVTDHVMPLKYRTSNSSGQKDHIKYMKNHIDTLDGQLYPGL